MHQRSAAIWPVSSARFKSCTWRQPHHQSAERRVTKIADEFIAAEFEDDADAKAWLVEKIAAALEKARDAGYNEAMPKRFRRDIRRVAARRYSAHGNAFTGSSLTSRETISGLFLIEWDGEQETPNAVAPR